MAALPQERNQESGIGYQVSGVSSNRPPAHARTRHLAPDNRHPIPDNRHPITGI
jgi:hypothetical protein